MSSLIRKRLLGPAAGLVWTSLAAGSASALFLWSLDRVSTLFEANPSLVWGLPAAGLLSAYVYRRWGGRAEEGTSLLLAELAHPREKSPARMTPFIFLGTLLTHLFGGSAGREGTAVQMGGNLADQASPWLGRDAASRSRLIRMGLAAGFGSLFGTPIAGAVFAFEIQGRSAWRRLGARGSRLDAAWTLGAAFAADAVTRAWGAPHAHYPDWTPFVEMQRGSIFALLALPFLFGITGCAYVVLLERSRSWITRLASPLGAPAAGGAIIALASLASGPRPLGLGLPVIAESFERVVPWSDSVWKLVLTAITVGTGFKGGEVTPLFFIGSTLGSAASQVLALPLTTTAGLGFVAVIAAAAQVPLAATALAFEMFGASSPLLALPICLGAAWIAGLARCRV